MRIVVVGTGTDVGKTHVSCSLLIEARARGIRARAYKPIATGVPRELGARCEDAERHADALGLAYEPPTFTYERPISPHLAAREEGRPISLDVIEAAMRHLEDSAELLLVETAGGLYSPLGPGVRNVELARRLLPARVLLVAPDRIGVLHDIGAALSAASVPVAALVLSAPATKDASTGSNAAELSQVGLPAAAAAFPRARPDDAESRAAAAALLDALLALR